MNRHIFLFALFIVGLFFINFAQAKSTNSSYGKNYGGPEAKVTRSVPNGKTYYSGPGVTLVPVVQPVSKESVKKIHLDMTHKIIDVGAGKKFNAWTFGNEVPGPVIHVRQGDKIDFTLSNRTHETLKFAIQMPHSIDFHAAMVNPQDKYRTILPKQSIHFTWVANYPGVFMYHCATPSVLHHLAKGMYGMVIVDPKNGYPTKVDREYALVQSEFYLKDTPEKNGVYEINLDKMRANQPTHVVFNGKANRHITETLKAKPGERVRLYVLNAGPSGTSSFHVIGVIMDRVWVDGNPANEHRGLQTILLGASSGAIVEFVVPESGKFVFVDHEFADAEKGAAGAVDATTEKSKKHKAKVY